jgi:hypothetical protein
MAETETPAALLRRAAAHMRDHHGPGHPRHKFWAQLADWLDEVAADRHSSLPAWVDDGTLRVARAYLGETGE